MSTIDSVSFIPMNVLATIDIRRVVTLSEKAQEFLDAHPSVNREDVESLFRDTDVYYSYTLRIGSATFSVDTGFKTAALAERAARKVARTISSETRAYAIK